MKSDRRRFIQGVAAGVCTPLLGGMTASCASPPGPVPATAGSAKNEERVEREEPAVESAPEEGVPLRTFGRHEEQVSVIGLGGHTLKFSESPDHAREILARAIDLGVRFFDNAWQYHGGEAEEWMGYALQGQDRSKLFLMSKFSTFNDKKYPDNKAGAMKMLEDSLRRLRTDHLDLWMLHNVSADHAERAYRDDSALAALELAKEQGKIRFTGFTGHTDPQIHVDLIQGGFEWDATLMPVSALGALSAHQFEREVMPLCQQKNIAVLGMKGFGGSKRAFLHGKTNVEEIVRYSLSYDQVCTHLIGIDKLEYVDQAIAAASKKPMSDEERTGHALKMKARDGERYAMYLDPEYRNCYREGRIHPCQLG